MTIPSSTSVSRAPRTMLNKVPAVGLLFWVVKILSTTVGETGADFLNMDLGLGLTVTTWIALGLLAVSLSFQLLSRRYIPWLYWMTVLLISVTGTLITDNLTDVFGVSLWASTGVFAAALAAVFASWWLVERTLSIHTITTTRRESFYWLAILFTFALGTAAGDLFADELGLGFAISGLVFAGLIAIVYAVFKISRTGAVAAFWIAYVLTRPLGASLADWLSQSPAAGGVGLGTQNTSLVFLIGIVASVIYFQATRQREAVNK